MHNLHAHVLRQHRRTGDNRIRYLLGLRAQALAWRYAVLANTPDSYSYYLNNYPGGYYEAQAMRLREQPRIRPIDPVIAPPDIRIVHALL